MLHNTMIVLATVAALTLTSDAFARGGGGGFGGGGMHGGFGGAHIGAGFEGRSVAVRGHHGGTWRGFTPVYGLGCTYGSSQLHDCVLTQ
jgi:hypothetical protein